MASVLQTSGKFIRFLLINRIISYVELTGCFVLFQDLKIIFSSPFFPDADDIKIDFFDNKSVNLIEKDFFNFLSDDRTIFTIQEPVLENKNNLCIVK